MTKKCYFLIKLKNPAELRIKYNRRFVPFYAAAGDEITIDIDYTKEGNPISINGDHAEFSQQMIDYNELFQDSFDIELKATLSFALIREFKEQRGPGPPPGGRRPGGRPPRRN